jgi:hypothetical protein
VAIKQNFITKYFQRVKSNEQLRRFLIFCSVNFSQSNQQKTETFRPCKKDSLYNTSQPSTESSSSVFDINAKK